MVIEAQRVYSEVEMFTENSPIVFGALVEIGSLDIIDNLECSEWNKFLTRMKVSGNGTGYRLSHPGHETTSPSDFKRATQYSPDRSQKRWSQAQDEDFIQLKVESVRPYPALATTELRADVEIAPIRCYVDQDALEFLMAFFSSPSIPQTQDEDNNGGDNNNRPRNSPTISPEPYFQAVHVSPVGLRFDYKPKHLNFGQVRNGSMVELLNLFTLEDADMTLNAAYIHGVEGFQKLAHRMVDHWLPHVTRTQMPGLVSGLAPLRSLVNIGNGMADLVFLPVQQYKKDGRIIKGIQRGAKSFTKSATLGMLDIGARMAVNAQILLEQAG